MWDYKKNDGLYESAGNNDKVQGGKKLKINNYY